MKKRTTILLLSLLLCALASCGDKEVAETNPNSVIEPDNEGPAISEDADTQADAVGKIDEEETMGETGTQESSQGYLCVFEEGFTVEIGSVAEDMTATFGEALNVAEAPSCIHEGTDRIYTYNGFTITTMPDGKGQDRIQEVALLSDAVMLEGGVSIGSTLDDVARVFGSDYTEQFGVLQYQKESVKISIVLDEDSCVTGLVITANQ